MGKGLLFIMDHDTNKVSQYSKQLMCEETGLSYEEPQSQHFLL